VNKQEPKAGDYVNIGFKAHTGKYGACGTVKAVSKTHLTVLWAGNETTYERRHIQYVQVAIRASER
jgi:hypothetical protein